MLVASFLKKKGLNSCEIPPILFNGITCYSNKEKAKVFNDFFISQSTVENEDDELPQIPHTDAALSEIELNNDLVKEIISGLDKKKAVGPDLVHNRLLIAALPVILTPLTMLFNRCLNECKFPLVWKTAHVNPIHKKSFKELCTNYRPISLLSCVGKILERCVHKHVFHFLSLHNIITPCQSGFTPGDSTVNQLVCIYNDLCSSHDQGIATQAVYFDISKAFDRVWHKGLIHKLDANGIRGKLLEWFVDYLSNRIQAVVIKGDQSEYKNITAGVPQGSVLGPLLFLIYINDIVEGIQSIIKLFADDTSMSLALNDPALRAEILNSDLEKIYSWSKCWKMKFNDEKTELLNITRNMHTVLPLTFGSARLQSSEQHKHLGITLQCNCKWDVHIKSIVSTVTMLTSCLKTYKHKLSRKALEIMYKSFILPHFDYADIVWDNCTDAQAASLENLHLDAIRTIIGAVRGTSHQKLYEESGFTSLRERRRRHRLIFYFKMIHGMCPNYLSNLIPDLVSVRNPYHRPRPLERVVPLFRTELYHRSFIPATTELWNDIPDSMKSCNSLSVFKRNLREHDCVVPSYFHFGNRKEQIVHCRLRLGISDLNDDLVTRHLLNDPRCACGFERETAGHYLLACPIFNAIRVNTLANLPQDYLNCNILLRGGNDLSYESNVHIFETVHLFISRSSRF